jgi:hypothetical protein
MRFADATDIDALGAVFAHVSPPPIAPPRRLLRE